MQQGSTSEQFGRHASAAGWLPIRRSSWARSASSSSWPASSSSRPSAKRAARSQLCPFATATIRPTAGCGIHSSTATGATARICHWAGAAAWRSELSAWHAAGTWPDSSRTRRLPAIATGTSSWICGAWPSSAISSDNGGVPSRFYAIAAGISVPGFYGGLARVPSGASGCSAAFAGRLRSLASEPGFLGRGWVQCAASSAG